MNTARISSTRSLPTICLTLLLGIAAQCADPGNADPPADPSAKPTPNKAFAGTWRAKIKMGGTDVPFVWVTDGQAFSTYIEGQPAPFITGTLEAANGHWKTKTAFAPLDEGPFHFIDADTISHDGNRRPRKSFGGVQKECGAIRRRCRRRSLPAKRFRQPRGIRRFDRRLGPAPGRAGHPGRVPWNFASKPARRPSVGTLRRNSFASTCGALMVAGMCPTGAHSCSSAPLAQETLAQETGLRFGSSTTRSTPALSPRNCRGPVAVPETVLPPDEAIRRLWDLAPTVRPDQVYLQLIRPGVEKPVLADSDGEPTSYPLNRFLRNFRAPLKDQETNATKGRLVWRMFALRDHDAVMDLPHGAFIAIDALNGAALSKRAAALGVQLYMRDRLTPPSPIEAFQFPDGPIPLDSPAEQVGTFNASRSPKRPRASTWGCGSWSATAAAMRKSEPPSTNWQTGRNGSSSGEPRMRPTGSRCSSGPPGSIPMTCDVEWPCSSAMWMRSSGIKSEPRQSPCHQDQRQQVQRVLASEAIRSHRRSARHAESNAHGPRSPFERMALQDGGPAAYAGLLEVSPAGDRNSQDRRAIQAASFDLTSNHAAQLACRRKWCRIGKRRLAESHRRAAADDLRRVQPRPRQREFVKRRAAAPAENVVDDVASRGGERNGRSDDDDLHTAADGK